MGKRKHGLSIGKPRLYSIWVNMKARCNNKQGRDYHKYGGRGIQVCEEWQKDYTVFREWALAHGYQDNLTIDRIDNNGNYCPENCRWTTTKVQNNNQRSNILITYNNEIHTLQQWSEILSIKYTTLYRRIHLGWDIDKTFTQKVRKSHNVV